jgi:hypothetical protein
MSETFSTFDLASGLTSDESIQVFVMDALETRNLQFISSALDIVARAKGMSCGTGNDSEAKCAARHSMRSASMPDSRLAAMLTLRLPIPWSELRPVFEARVHAAEAKKSAN